jgi:hypothetical protein
LSSLRTAAIFLSKIINKIFIFILLLLATSGSVYAGCTVNGVTESGAISLANLKTAIATGTDFDYYSPLGRAQA